MDKETEPGMFIGKKFQRRWFVLDYNQWEFKYSKTPKDTYTIIKLKDVKDFFIESYDERVAAMAAAGNFDKENVSITFKILTGRRMYRFQVKSLVELTMWSRAFSLLFELRIRVCNHS